MMWACPGAVGFESQGPPLGAWKAVGRVEALCTSLALLKEEVEWVEMRRRQQCQWILEWILYANESQQEPD